LNKNLTKNLNTHISAVQQNIKNHPAKMMEQLIKQNLRPTKDKAMQFSTLLKKSSQVQPSHQPSKKPTPHSNKKTMRKRLYGQKTSNKMAPTSAKPNMDELKFVSDKLDNFEQRFRNRFVQDAYYNLPRSL